MNNDEHNLSRKKIAGMPTAKPVKRDQDLTPEQEREVKERRQRERDHNGINEDGSNKNEDLIKKLSGGKK